MSEGTILTNGVTLHVSDSGSGDAIVLLHGFPDSGRLWRNQVPALIAGGYRVIVPDLRGFGRSDRPQDAASYAMPLLADDVKGLLDELDVERAHIVGHDWGAVVAWAFAGREAERARSVVAISVGHPHSFMKASASQTRKSWYALFFQIPKVPETVLRRNDWKLFRKLFGGSRDFDRYIDDLERPGALTAGLNYYRANGKPQRMLSPSLYPRISVPAMGIWGVKDWALGEAQMTGSERFCDSSWRYERMDCGHWIPLSRPDALSALLLEFAGA